MKIIVTDCDHDKMVQEEEVFAKANAAGKLLDLTLSVE